MKIKAKINGENQPLVDALTKRGITAKLVKGGVIIELPLIPLRKNKSWSDPDTYYEILPEVKEVNSAMLLIEITESGGGMTNTGSGRVVCGLSGKALRPYYVPRSGHLACGTHAYFSVPNAVVTITGYRRSNEVMIEEHRIVRDGNVAWIESKELWSGDLEVLPEFFNRFQAAAKAAKAKGNCYHCRCLHFAQAS